MTTFDQAKAAAPPQSPRIISPDYKNPFTWQSSIGFQKQINSVTGFEADLTHFNQYNDTRTIDPNLFYNPATGYNVNPAAINGVPNRPNPAYTQIAYFVSTGRRDQTQISTALNRRFKNNFQSGVTYTYMVSMHDDGNIGYTAPGQNNQFDYLDGEYGTSTDFQKHTLRAWTLYRLPWGFSASVSYFYGSGARFNATINTAVYGKAGTNRLNLTAAGAPTNAIVIPATATLANGDVIEIASRFHGPSTIASGETIPRNALQGLPLHKVDLRLTKDIAIRGTHEDLADWRGLQPLQPSQLRQLQLEPERDRRGDHRAVRPAAAEHGQRLHLAAGAVRVQIELLAYSSRNATFGFSPAARCAGIQAAIAAMMVNITAIAANVAGSVADTPPAGSPSRASARSRRSRRARCRRCSVANPGR